MKERWSISNENFGERIFFVKSQYAVLNLLNWQIFYKFTFFFQLKDENDYYYTVFNQKKKAREDGIDLKKGRRFFFGEEESDDENEDNDEDKDRWWIS